MSHSKIAKLVAEVSRELQIDIPDIDKMAIMQEVRNLVKTNHPVPELMNSDSENDQGTSSDVEIVSEPEMEERNTVNEDVIEIESDDDEKCSDMQASVSNRDFLAEKKNTTSNSNKGKLDKSTEIIDLQNTLSSMRKVNSDNLVGKNLRKTSRSRFFKRNPWLTRQRKKRKWSFLNRKSHYNQQSKVAMDRSGYRCRSALKIREYSSSSSAKMSKDENKALPEPIIVYKCKQNRKENPDTTHKKTLLDLESHYAKRETSDVLKKLETYIGPDTSTKTPSYCDTTVTAKSLKSLEKINNVPIYMTTKDIIKKSMRKYPGIILKDVRVELENCIQVDCQTDQQTRVDDVQINEECQNGLFFKCGVPLEERFGERWERKYVTPKPVWVGPRIDYSRRFGIDRLVKLSNEKLAKEKIKLEMETFGTQRLSVEENSYSLEPDSILYGKRKVDKFQASDYCLSGSEVSCLETPNKQKDPKPHPFDDREDESLDSQPLLDPATGHFIFKDLSEKIKQEPKNDFFDLHDKSQNEAPKRDNVNDSEMSHELQTLVAASEHKLQGKLSEENSGLIDAGRSAIGYTDGARSASTTPSTELYSEATDEDVLSIELIEETTNKDSECNSTKNTTNHGSEWKYYKSALADRVLRIEKLMETISTENENGDIDNFKHFALQKAKAELDSLKEQTGLGRVGKCNESSTVPFVESSSEENSSDSDQSAACLTENGDGALQLNRLENRGLKRKREQSGEKDRIGLNENSGERSRNESANCELITIDGDSEKDFGETHELNCKKMRTIRHKEIRRIREIIAHAKTLNDRSRDTLFLSKFDMLVRRELYKTLLAPEAIVDDLETTLPLFLDVKTDIKASGELKTAFENLKTKLRRKWMKIINMDRFGQKQLDQISKARIQARSLEFLRKSVIEDLKQCVNKSMTFERLCKTILVSLDEVLEREKYNLTEISLREIEKIFEEDIAKKRRDLCAHEYIALQVKETAKLRNINLQETQIAKKKKMAISNVEVNHGGQTLTGTLEIKTQDDSLSGFSNSRMKEAAKLRSTNIEETQLAKMNSDSLNVYVENRTEDSQADFNVENELILSEFKTSGSSRRQTSMKSKYRYESSLGKDMSKVRTKASPENLIYPPQTQLQKRCPLLFFKLQQHVENSLARSTKNLLSDSVRENLAYKIATNYAEDHADEFKSLEGRITEHGSESTVSIKEEPVDDYIVVQNIDDEEEEEDNDDDTDHDADDKKVGKTDKVAAVPILMTTAGQSSVPSSCPNQVLEESQTKDLSLDILIKQEPVEPVATEVQPKSQVDKKALTPLSQIQSVVSSIPAITEFVAPHSSKVQYIAQSALKLSSVPNPVSSGQSKPIDTQSTAKSALANKLRNSNIAPKPLTCQQNLGASDNLLTVQGTATQPTMAPVTFLSQQTSQTPVVTFYLPQAGNIQPGTMTAVLPQYGTQTVAAVAEPLIGQPCAAASNLVQSTFFQPTVIAGLPTPQPVLVPVVTPSYCLPQPSSALVLTQNLAVPSSASFSPVLPVQHISSQPAAANAKVPISKIPEILPSKNQSDETRTRPVKGRVKRWRNPTPPLDICAVSTASNEITTKSPLSLSTSTPPKVFPSQNIQASSTTTVPPKQVLASPVVQAGPAISTPTVTKQVECSSEAQDSHLNSDTPSDSPGPSLSSQFCKLPIPPMQLADFLAMQLRYQIEAANKIAEKTPESGLNLPFLNNSNEIMTALNAPILKSIDSPLLAALNSTVIKALEGTIGMQKTKNPSQSVKTPGEISANQDAVNTSSAAVNISAAAVSNSSQVVSGEPISQNHVMASGEAKPPPAAVTIPTLPEQLRNQIPGRTACNTVPAISMSVSSCIPAVSVGTSTGVTEFAKASVCTTSVKDSLSASVSNSLVASVKTRSCSVVLNRISAGYFKQTAKSGSKTGEGQEAVMEFDDSTIRVTENVDKEGNLLQSSDEAESDRTNQKHFPVFQEFEDSFDSASKEAVQINKGDLGDTHNASNELKDDFNFPSRPSEMDTELGQEKTSKTVGASSAISYAATKESDGDNKLNNQALTDDPFRAHGDDASRICRSDEVGFAFEESEINESEEQLFSEHAKCSKAEIIVQPLTSESADFGRKSSDAIPIPTDVSSYISTSTNTVSESPSPLCSIVSYSSLASSETVLSTEAQSAPEARETSFATSDINLLSPSAKATATEAGNPLWLSASVGIAGTNLPPVSASVASPSVNSGVDSKIDAPLPIKPPQNLDKFPIPPGFIAAPLDGAFKVTLPDETINRIIEDAIQSAGVTLTPKAQELVKTQLDRISVPKDIPSVIKTEVVTDNVAEAKNAISTIKTTDSGGEEPSKDGHLTTSKTRRKNDPFFKLPTTGVLPIRHVSEDGTISWTCTLCGKSFTRNYTYRRHADSHSKIKAWKCDICSKAFTDRRYLLKHMRWHTGKNLQYCAECGRAFSDELAVTKHMKVHNTNKTYACQRCPKVFADSQTLKRHNLHVHDQVKSHRCELCHLSFVFKSHLDDHMKRHTGEKPHKCSICGKGFIQVGTRNRHERQHKGGQGGNPYKCAICMNVFWFKEALRNHFYSMHPDIPVPETHKKMFEEVELAAQHANVSKEETKIRVEHIPRERYPTEEDNAAAPAFPVSETVTAEQLVPKALPVPETSTEEQSVFIPKPVLISETCTDKQPVFIASSMDQNEMDMKVPLRQLIAATTDQINADNLAERLVVEDVTDIDSKEHLRKLVEEQEEKEKLAVEEREKNCVESQLYSNHDTKQCAAEEVQRKADSSGKGAMEKEDEFENNAYLKQIIKSKVLDAERRTGDFSEGLFVEDCLNKSLTKQTSNEPCDTARHINVKIEDNHPEPDRTNHTAEKGVGLKLKAKMKEQTDKIASLMELFRETGVPGDSDYSESNIEDNNNSESNSEAEANND